MCEETDVMINPNTVFKEKRGIVDKPEYTKHPLDVSNYEEVNMICSICGLVRHADVSKINILYIHLTLNCPVCARAKWTVEKVHYDNATSYE